MNLFATLVRRRTSRRSIRRCEPLRVEPLESRTLLATFTVASLVDAGAGSLRAAINEANAAPGPDAIVFAVNGVIPLSSPLPAISDQVSINGSTAPGFVDRPRVVINYRGQTGLIFTTGSDGSTLANLGLVRATGAGVTLVGSRNTLTGNFIGVVASGVTAAGNSGPGVIVRTGSSGNRIGVQGSSPSWGNVISGNGGDGIAVLGSDNVIAGNTIGLTAAGDAALPNGGDGIRVLSSSTGNLIGHADPVSSISYFDASHVTPAVEAWHGLRGSATPHEYLFAGTSGDDGLVYVGPIEAVGGNATTFQFPGATLTSANGPDEVEPGLLRVVGSYVDGGTTRYGFLYEGAIDDFGNASNFRTIRPDSNPEFTYAHSTMGGLLVGNYDSATEGGLPIGAGKAFLYDIASDSFLEDIAFPGAASTTAYGVWWNGGGSYTIAGGFAVDPVNNLASDDDQRVPIGQAFLVDYDSATGAFHDWTPFVYPNGPADAEFVTHFEGISSVEAGVYTLAATSAQVGIDPAIIGSFVTVRRNTDGTFGDGVWQDIAGDAADETAVTSVFGSAVTAIGIDGNSATPFQATVTTSFQLSNVIGGNTGNGIAITGANDNHVAMNFVGTSRSGTAAVPNAGNGILITDGASGTMIGGQATGGNDPTDGVFVRPPQGNLISGNGGNGVLITGGATGNTLSGNFIGTTATGNAPLGNGGDGVAIVSANGNGLIGTTFHQSPFVFYNVLSGNIGHGLRITNSNDTIVQANFTGLGANNATVVANGGNGILVNGTSARTIAGGVIPLGNVTSGNNRHGILIAGKSSGLVSFNNFAGMVAFGGAAPNSLNGIHVTSTGGGNVIRTCLVAGNRRNGIVLAGDATGVTIEDTAAGTNAAIGAAIPNDGSGILITGNANGNVIGGFRPSVETKVHLSGNLRYGLEITGSARNNTIFNTVIGGGFQATTPIPNGLGGVFIGPGTSGTVFGGAQPSMANRVLFNAGAGIRIRNSDGNRILGNEIRENAGSGIILAAGLHNRIGNPGRGNMIVSNGLNGIQVSGHVRGSVLAVNTIIASASNGLLLDAATDFLVGGQADGMANTIVTNGGFGLLAMGVCSGTQVIRNVIAQNALGNVNLATSTGITYVP